MPLTMARPSDGVLLIKKVNGKDDVIRHLADMGFVAGQTVEVMSEIAGNLIVKVKETRVALDRSLAQRITV